MNAHASIHHDWIASISECLRRAADCYHKKLEQLEQKKRASKGVGKKRVDDEIEQCRKELWADLAGPRPYQPELLVSGFVDKVTLWVRADWQRREDAQQSYMDVAQNTSFSGSGSELLGKLCLNPWPPPLLHSTWLALAVDFELLTPWYSKDDRPFHVLDNPVRKDRVFGVPFMAAASWKGVLRWACRMQAGLRQHLEEGKRFDAWTDPDWILHLFGNEKGEEDHEKLRQGALVFYPTWFDKIGFEVINPHDRSRRAGTQPIYYEVVPGKRPGQDGGKGTLHLLYAPWPGMNPAAAEEEWLPKLLEAIEDLLTRYGISAKRTVGWGTAEIKKWRAWRDNQPIEADSRDELVHKLGLDAGGGS